MSAQRPSRACSGCGIPTRGASGICMECSSNHAARPCLICRAVTTSAERHCSSCMRHINEAQREPAGSGGLPEGAWVLDKRRRVMVWQEADRAPAMTTPDRWSRAEAARRQAEEQTFSGTEARRAHQAYKRGDRTEWATTGHRVYCRRIDRERRAKRSAA